MKKVFGKFKDWLTKDKKNIFIVLIVIAAVIFFVSGFKGFLKERDAKRKQEQLEALQTQQTPTGSNKVDYGVYDSEVYKKQEALQLKYGTPPDGFLVDLDGTYVSLGDDSTSEEVLYYFLNGVRTLDFETAQKYSKGSSVIQRYNNFFDPNLAKNASYVDTFYRNMYKEVLTSIQVKSILDTASFANNKKVYTVELEMLDLSDKSFWQNDKMEIYETLYIYSRDELDSTKSEQYVYDYVLNHYKSGNAVRKNVTVNITVEKYARLKTGWLVTIDKDIDDYCYYTDGNVVARYILRDFNDVGKELIKSQRREEEERAKEEAKAQNNPEGEEVTSE